MSSGWTKIWGMSSRPIHKHTQMDTCASGVGEACTEGQLHASEKWHSSAELIDIYSGGVALTA